MTIVHRATQADVPGILSLCFRAHEELPAGRSLSRAKVLSMVEASLNPHHGVIGIIKDGSGVCAMTGLSVSACWYSADRELGDWLTYVRPDCRTRRYFFDLIRFAKAEAKARNLPLWLGFVGNDRPRPKHAAYQRQGLTPYGQLYRYEAM